MTFGVEPELADHDEALRGERLVELHQVEVVHGEPGAFEQLPAPRESARCPSRGDRPLATAEPTKAPSGSASSSRAFSSEAMTSAAARSLIPPRARAQTVLPRGTPAGASRASPALCRAGMLVPLDAVHRDQLVREVRRGPALLRAQRERVLFLARDWKRSATFSPVSPIDSSGNICSIRGLGKRQPSVVSQTVRFPARKALLRLRHHMRRAGHGLDPAGDEEPVTRGDRVARRDDSREPRGAEPV